MEAESQSPLTPKGGEAVRCFVSLPVPAAIQEKIGKFQRSLDSKIPSEAVRWTAPEQIHVTLKFLGKVETAALPELTDALANATRGSTEVRLTAESLGCFPSRKNPRVIWIGLSGDVAPLSKLQARVDQNIAQWAQKEEDRKFNPHLTIGRLRENAMRHSRQTGAILESVTAPKFGSWTGTEIHLMQSQLSPKGAVHTILQRFTLR